MTKTRHGGQDRISTKTRLASELIILGRTLAAVRERGGLKQADVAARLGLPASYLSKIENGTRRIDVVELLALARALGSDPGEVIREIEAALGAAATATQKESE